MAITNTALSNLVSEYLELKGISDQTKARMEEIKNTVRRNVHLGETVLPTGKINYDEHIANVFDGKKFGEDHPDLKQQYTFPQTRTRLEIKA